MKLTEDLRTEYKRLFAEMEIHNKYMVQKFAVRIMENRRRYETVEKETGVPWFVIGCIHLLEGNMDFSRQLFNGEFYDKVTTRVPAGKGPWISWEHSAIEAMKELNKKMEALIGNSFEWTIPVICYAFESHNGWGYRKYHSHVKSPYLWSYSNHYIKGKYVSDGQWDEEAASKQLGAMVVIKAIKNKQGYLYKPVRPRPVPNPSDGRPARLPLSSSPEDLEEKTTWQKIKCWFKGLF